MSKRKKRILIVVSIVMALLIIAYIILTNVLVSAALVPSFMEKLDAFEDITVQSYSEMVWTDDITTNENAVLQETSDWYKQVNHEKINITSDDGYNLVACRFLQNEYSDKWALVLHGYTGWKEEMYEFAMWYYEQGYNVLVPDLRAQGESEGDYIGMGWTDSFDCLKWLSIITDIDSNASIVIHGQSMGASTALIMSGNEALPTNVKAIISDCGYTDGYSMFGDKIKAWFNLPAFPLVDSAVLCLKLRGGYDLMKASAIDAVRKSNTPTLFIHGSDDAMISVDMAYQLYDAENADKELLIVDGAGHAQSQYKEPDKYYETIRVFLNSIK